MKHVNVKSRTDLEEEIKACKIKPRRHHLLVTINRYDSNSDLEIDAELDDTIEEWQYVIAAGDGQMDYKVGDKVLINLPAVTTRRKDQDGGPDDYIISLNLTPVISNDNVFTIISDNYILGKEVEYDQVDLSM